MISRAERRRRLDAFDSIVIPHPRMNEVENRILDLIDDTHARIAKDEKRQAQVKGRSLPVDHLWVLPIIGPSGATKSKTISTVIERLLADKSLGDRDVPVLHATIRTSTRNPRALQAQILEAYGDNSSTVLLNARDYSETRVNADIRAIARDRKTSIVVFDEAHNMIINGAEKSTVAMAKSMKSLVNDGIFSIVCVGTNELAQLFAADKELAGRLVDTVDFGAFSIKEREERDYFFNFVGLLEDEMRLKGVIDKEIGLLDTVENRACVYDFASGVIGSVSRIMKTALDRAFANDRGFVKWDDIERSIQARNRASKAGDGVTYYDPFLKGVKRDTLRILAEEEAEMSRRNAAAAS
ncbi:MAG: AAA family ATPase [Rhizobiales bacterium]|nr:AAA family ATPase [Hyphomicrobiales bacterium]